MLKHLGVLLAGCFAVVVGHAAPATPAPAPTTTHEVGKNYFVIDPPQATATGGNIEVLEVFSYACPHCAHFQPYAEQIKAALPAYATYDYMPAVFRPDWEPFARAYYTSKALGVFDKSHQALFDALHRDHLPLRTLDDLAGFYAKFGVDNAKFVSEANSFEIESKLTRAAALVKADGVDGTPSIVINGKYRVSAASAGGYTQLIDLVKWLVEKEHANDDKAPKSAKPKKPAKKA